MKAYRSYLVAPRLPESLQGLRTIAYNLWWSWNPDARELMRRIDLDLWERTSHNPVAMLGLVSQERWEQMADDEAFCQHLERALASLQSYLNAETWFDRMHPQYKGKIMAYFSLEYGLNEALAIYAGGLGVLAGDHLKSASDMGVPICGVGLLYQVGYFRQYLNADGWQQEAYTENEFQELPVEPVLGSDGCQLRVAIPTAAHLVTAVV